MAKRKTFIALVVILQLFTQLLNVECRPEAKKGKGKAFGAGILAGGLAGAAMGHLLTRQNNPAEVHHHHHMVDTNAAASNTAVPAALTPISAPRPSAIIERGETLANGCYKQIIKEPNAYDVTQFIETEQLICPANVAAPPTYTQQMPAVPAVPVPQTPPQAFVPAMPVIPISIPASPPAIPAVFENVSPPHVPADTPLNPESVHTGSLAPPAPAFSEAQQNHGAAPIVPVVQQPQQPPLPPLPAQPVQPGVQAILPIPSSVPGHVIVLSKKTGFYEEDKMKKNLADNLIAVNFGLMLLLAGFLYFI